MGSQFATDTQLHVLRLLRDAPGGQYGLQLIEASGGKLKRGTIYVMLGRLEEKGFVKSSVLGNIGHAGLPRPIYKITALGERALLAAEVMNLGAEGI